MDDQVNRLSVRFFRNPSSLTRYGQKWVVSPAWSHDASGGIGRGADTQLEGYFSLCK